jgi:peroxiredoxin (alkyl hydroperoxide reductase subunit C)
MSESNRLPDSTGKRVPDVVFETREDGDWKEVTSKEIFDGRTVVLFALPGAFTPTCSSAHLPRYEELAPAFAARGVDEVICLSVNDAFVMDAWGREQGSSRVRLLPDGNGDFSEGLGMLVSKRNLGFGNRSWRYSMLVRDGVIEKMFIEPDVEGDPYEVSDADTMLRYLDPEAETGPNVSLFTRPGCRHCERARALLDARGIDYEQIVLDDDVTTRSLRAVTGRDTVPQVFIDGKHIGGADELEAHLAS